MEADKIQKAYNLLRREFNQIRGGDFDDLSDKQVYNKHANLVVECGNVVMAKQFRQFLVDDYNKDILRFLTYYFNNNPLAETVFEGKGYKISKNLMLCGTVGVGKTMLMQVFEKYLRITNNPNAFYNLSVTQMINYYKINNHLDRYTYNEESTEKYEGNPVNVCLNDIGLQSHTHFGTDTKILVTDFFHARNEIWAQQGKYAHITTNLTPVEMKDYLNDGYGRLTDRMKSYNVINLVGDSRR